MLLMCEMQAKKVGNVNQSQYRPDENRHKEPLLVMLDM